MNEVKIECEIKKNWKFNLVRFFATKMNKSIVRFIAIKFIKNLHVADLYVGGEKQKITVSFTEENT